MKMCSPGSAATAAAALFTVLSLHARADAGLPDCALAQQVIAGTELVPEVQYPADFDAFVESKSFDTPFVVQQFLSNPHPESPGLMRTLSCKMRTAERINAAHTSDAALPQAIGDSSCSAVTRALLERAMAAVPPAEQALNMNRFTIAEEQATYMGPMWLDPWPFHAASVDAAGQVTLQSRALYVPRAWWIPLPERFQGNYYCHLISPSYLRSIIRGEARFQT